MGSVTRANFQESAMGSAVKNVINRGWLAVIQNEADWWSRVIRSNRSSARFNERARISIPSMESNYEPSRAHFLGLFRLNAVCSNGSRDITSRKGSEIWIELKRKRGRKNEEECGGIDMKLLKIETFNETSEVEGEVITVTRYRFPCFCLWVVMEIEHFRKNILILETTM